MNNIYNRPMPPKYLRDFNESIDVLIRERHLLQNQVNKKKALIDALWEASRAEEVFVLREQAITAAHNG